ncbi:MAG: hypothetical protein GTO41_09540 [Burkholderiales bacterium]|nr:hypothetical protein [Burkholderiales bacterium]
MRHVVLVGAKPGYALTELLNYSLLRPGRVALASVVGMKATRVDAATGFANVYGAACVRNQSLRIERRI